MSKNLFPQIAEMLNVDIGEEFKLQEIDNKIYKIELNGFWQRTENQKCWDSMEGSFFELNAILMGKRTVVKLPWKPKKGETYYTFELLNGKWIVHLLWWIDSPNEYALLDKGWVYRSQAEAETALPAVAAEMEVQYEL